MSDIKIPFSPPDITDIEINEVVNVMKSGWITTGSKTKEFQNSLSNYCNTKKALCLNSATTGLFLTLKYFGIGKGDEVITTPFSYAASSNVILHCGAKPVFVDINKNDYFIDIERIRRKISKRTKAIITVDYGGWCIDYNRVQDIIAEKKSKFIATRGTPQEKINRIIHISDSAHSFGATYNEKKTGGFADFTVFSFHAVKNLTTAEGGAILFNDIDSISSDEIYKELSLLALHGQNKDALEKYKNNSWRYDILLPGYKYNMTDIQAAVGLAQLSRYDNEILKKRNTLFQNYMEYLSSDSRIILPDFDTAYNIGSKHLFPIRIKSYEEQDRDLLITKLNEQNISVNVHFIPIVMFTAYKKLGYDIKNFPNAYNQFKNTITLPLYSKMSIEQVSYVCEKLIRLI